MVYFVSDTIAAMNNLYDELNIFQAIGESLEAVDNMQEKERLELFAVLGLRNGEDINGVHAGTDEGWTSASLSVEQETENKNVGRSIVKISTILDSKVSQDNL